jgi:hypothetical protein
MYSVLLDDKKEKKTEKGIKNVYWKRILLTMIVKIHYWVKQKKTNENLSHLTI